MNQPSHTFIFTLLTPALSHVHISGCALASFLSFQPPSPIDRLFRDPVVYLRLAHVAANTLTKQSLGDLDHIALGLGVMPALLDVV